MITVHGRTRTQGFGGRASLDIIARVRAVLSREIPLVGNGDVMTLEDYVRMREHTGCDAVMIGRGAMGNPWLFARIRAHETGAGDPGAPTGSERLRLALRHLALVLEHAPPRRQLAEIRKVCAWYSRGQRAGSELRARAFSETHVDTLLIVARNYFRSLADADRTLTSCDPTAQIGVRNAP
jgi:tRNA-dihydrouridine synthase